MRIRPLQIALIALAVGATYSIVSVVASIAEIKSVGERLTAAASAQAQRSPQREPQEQEPVEVRDATGSDVEPPGEFESPESRESIEEADAAPEPSAAEQTDDAVPEEIDVAAAEEEERYNAKALHDDAAHVDEQ